MRWVLIAVLVLVSLAASGCGYGFRGRQNPWTAQGMRSVYVRMLTNNTLRSGLEVPFTSGIVREFARGRRINLVSDEKDADGYILGSIDVFESRVNSFSSVTGITKDPLARGLEEQVIASEYVANAAVTVTLISKTGGLLWSQQFTRSKIYPAGNRFGLQGTTSALINSSLEQLALNDIIQFIASDVYDTMLEAF